LSSWSSIAVLLRVVGSTLSLVGSWQRTVAATRKTRSDGVEVAVIPTIQVFSSSNLRMMETMFGFTKHGPRVIRQLMFRGPLKGPDFQASITVFERYCHGRIKGRLL